MGQLAIAGTAMHREPDSNEMDVCEHNQSAVGGENMDAFPEVDAEVGGFDEQEASIAPEHAP